MRWNFLFYILENPSSKWSEMTTRICSDYMRTSTFYVLSDKWPFEPGAFIKVFSFFSIHLYRTHTRHTINFLISLGWRREWRTKNNTTKFNSFYLFVSLGNFLNGIDLSLWPHSQLERQLFIYFFFRLLLLFHSFFPFFIGNRNVYLLLPYFSLLLWNYSFGTKSFKTLFRSVNILFCITFFYFFLLLRLVSFSSTST